MSPRKWIRAARPARPTALCLTLLLSAGCSASLSKRYTGLRAELRQPLASKPTESAVLPSPVDAPELTRQGLIADVLARNPSVEAARHGVRAALARYPQTGSLEDPVLSYSMAPGTIFSDSASFGQTITLSQRFPWPGKLALQGDVELAEAEARQDDYEVVRQRLAYMASSLFDDYYVVTRAAEVNREHAELLTRLQLGAEAQYAAGRGSQQAPLQVEVELAHVEHQQVVLRTRRSVVVAQLNGLLHHAPDSPMRPPPRLLEVAAAIAPAVPSPTGGALPRDRPELRAAQRRLIGAESAVQLAQRRYYPDFTLSGSYNSMWARSSHQFMIGVSINLPIQMGGRDAASEEARARVAQRRSELDHVTDEVAVEVAAARLRAAEARHVAHLYEQRLLPVARAQIGAAMSDFEAGRGGFVSVIDAERNLRRVQLQQHEVIADTHRRNAALVLALGRIDAGATP